MDKSQYKINEYFNELKIKLKDFRDNRGKKHILAFVILSFFIAILRSTGKLNYLMIFRQMQRDFDYLKELVQENILKPISYSQLKRIVSKIDYQEFNSITDSFFSKEITSNGLFWQAIDGKELRGTIDKVAGEKRSENIIQLVSHEEKQSQLIDFYNGAKESEKTIVQKFMEGKDNLSGQAFSFDALHTSSKHLENIDKRSGIYLAQVKDNQKKLLEDCKHTYTNLTCNYQYITEEKGHGRIEKRHGKLFNFNVECLDSRWKETNIQSLLVIERERFITKTKVQSKETAYFVSNRELKQDSAWELFKAARQHWAIESDNHIRDTNFGEDQIISFNKNASRMMAVAISSALNILRRINIDNNIKALREDLHYDITKFLSCFVPN